MVYKVAADYLTRTYIVLIFNSSSKETLEITQLENEFIAITWKRSRKLSPSPPTPASESSTKPSPTTQMAAPNNCHMEYLVPRKNHVRTMAQAMVQQSNNVTLVSDVN